MPRLVTWPDELHATLERHRLATYDWGRFDCGTLFRDCVLALTGDDPLDGYTWSNERGALSFLNWQGVGSVREHVTRRFDQIVPIDARRGDLCFTHLVGPLVCPAIVVGSEAVSRDHTGWLVFPREAITAAFKVG